MKIGYGRKKENRKTIAEIAKESLANHLITPEQTEGPVKMWLCHRKDSGMYHYRVISAPGMILVYGDVGDYMLQAYDRDLIPWLKNAVNSEDYLVGKIVNKGEEFLPDEADAMLTELCNECSDDYEREEITRRVEKVREDWCKDEDGPDDFAKAFVFSGGFESEMISSAVDYESGVYWTVECLKKFVELLESSEEEEDETCSSISALL